jgi:hypothetical protein
MPHPVHDRNNQSKVSYALLVPECKDDILLGSIQFFFNGKLKTQPSLGVFDKHILMSNFFE